MDFIDIAIRIAFFLFGLFLAFEGFAGAVNFMGDRKTSLSEKTIAGIVMLAGIILIVLAFC